MALDCVELMRTIGHDGFAAAWWHWFFLGNPAADAERVITADPEAWYRTHGKHQHFDR